MLRLLASVALAASFAQQHALDAALDDSTHTQCAVASSVRSSRGALRSLPLEYDSTGTPPPHHFVRGEGSASCAQDTQRPAYVALVHVGKTAGMSVLQMLSDAGVAFAVLHIDDAHWAVDCRFTHYIVSTRDPVNRTVSAFNWRHTDGGAEDDHISPAEARLYDECFPQLPGGANAFAESLGGSGRCAMLARACIYEPARGCRHLGRGHAYYLQQTGLMEVLRRDDKGLFVVRQESFEADMQRLWAWLCVPRAKRPATPAVHAGASPRQSDRALSARGEALLRQHLALEYFTLESVVALADAKNAGAPCDACPPADAASTDARCYGACVPHEA